MKSNPHELPMIYNIVLTTAVVGFFVAVFLLITPREVVFTGGFRANEAKCDILGGVHESTIVVDIVESKVMVHRVKCATKGADHVVKG